jgi:restriction system protein
MEKTNKCLLEWNAIVEALGQGKQSILVRNYQNTLKEFILYPTDVYLENENYMDSFQNKHQSFVEKNSEPKKDEPEYEIKYYATVEEEIEKPADGVNDLDEYHIWTNDHVQSYINSDTTFFWLLRVYKLKEPIMATRTNGMVYANLDESISLDGIEPVLSDAEFDKLKESLK